VQRARSRVLRLETSDGLGLEAEWVAPPEAKAVVVLCHPHPQYGGTMRSIVTSALFEALPGRGYACLRFNFRGVENSDGVHTEGRYEPLDILAALGAAASATPDLPLVLQGWSFGADMALTIDDSRIGAWVGVAPPLRFRNAADYEIVGRNSRPKLLVLAANDEYRAPRDVEADVASWANTRVEIVPGASHFFVGRTARVVEVVAGFVEEITLAR
jgi:alpha/beta superfamily hydrolase